MNFKMEIKKIEETNFLIKNIKNNFIDFNFNILKLYINEEIYILDLIYYQEQQEQIEFQITNKFIFEKLKDISINNFEYEINNEEKIKINNIKDFKFLKFLDQNDKKTEIIKIVVRKMK